MVYSASERAASSGSNVATAIGPSSSSLHSMPRTPTIPSNTPLTGKFNMYPKGGTTIEQLKMSGSSLGTLALGRLASAPAARALDTKCGVPCEIMDIPIGLLATDRFVNTLRKIAGVAVPESLNYERGQLVDIISDMHQYLYGKKVALVGDPDQLTALTEFLVSMDMMPIYVVTGTPGKKFERKIKELTKDVPHEVKVKAEGDMFLLHQWIKNENVDLLIGNTYCKYIAKDEDIPLVRFGFPILDRVGHSYFPTVGYQGAIRLLEKILDARLERKDRDASDVTMELVM